MASATSPSPAAVVLAVGGLYVSQSVIGGVTWTGLPAVLRDQGLALDNVGLLSLIALPWALKFLWAPMVERFRLPPVGRNRSGVIVAVGGGLSIARPRHRRADRPQSARACPRLPDDSGARRVHRRYRL